jgi:predicted TIM-barrel enzyme
MNAIERQFGVPRVLLPVVHPHSEDAAKKSIDTVVRAGVPGLFLINQGTDEKGVMSLAAWARYTHPKLWVGVNILGKHPIEALDFALDGLWTDNALIDERQRDQPEAEKIHQERLRRGWDGLYFGGVAFKYQRTLDTMGCLFAAYLASEYVDVVTTSGPGTGQPTPMPKILMMHEALRVCDNHALGIASGVTVENVKYYLPYVHAYLVGTSLETALGVLDEDRIRRLHECIQEGP